MTAPLTPPDCDLQDFPFMPLHVARLRDSDLAAECDPEGCWYAVLLWSAAWHQLPAGSLPDNDAILARLCNLGRDVKTFTKRRADAMRGWVRGNDGRLYHPVVAEQVLAAWKGKVEQRHRSECARIKKANQRNGTSLPSPDFQTFLAKTYPYSVPYLSPGTPDHVPGDMDLHVPRDMDGSVPGETPSKGKREGKGQGQGDNKKNSVANATAPSAPKPAAPPGPSKPTEAAETHLWTAGKKFLEARGVAKTQAGSVLGRWKGKYRTAAVLEALGVAEREPDLVDPIPFIERVLQRRAGEGGGGGEGYSIGGVRMSSPC